MGCKGRHLMAGVVACGLAAPAGASVLEPADGKLLASADDLVGIGLGAQPLPGSFPAAGQAAAQLKITEIASLVVSDRSAGASGEASGRALFWVFGSGLLGAAFIARRRKPVRRKA
ncbi:MAG: hypothetical protein JSU62_10995 [Gammaproteobacteria bacterium]|nr:MAG: hypothetical protein JSU62_10995 [Gammaproteobacteria bacterium]